MNWLTNLPSCGVILESDRNIVCESNILYPIDDCKLNFIYNNDDYFKIANDRINNKFGYAIIYTPDSIYPNPDYLQIECHAEIQNNTNKECSFFLKLASFTDSIYMPFNLMPNKTEFGCRIGFVKCSPESLIQLVRLYIDEIVVEQRINRNVQKNKLDIIIKSLYIKINLIYNIDNYTNLEQKWYSNIPLADSIYTKLMTSKDENLYSLIYDGDINMNLLPCKNSLFINNIGLSNNSTAYISEHDVNGKPYVTILNNETTFYDSCIYNKIVENINKDDKLTIKWNNNNYPTLGFDYIVHI